MNMNDSKTSTKDRHSIQWITSATKPYHGKVLFISFLGILSALASLWSALLLKDLIDAAVDGNKDLLIRTAVILALILLVSIALGLLSRYFKEKTKYLMINSLQIRLFSELLEKDYFHVTRLHSQEWMNRINEDSVILSNAISNMIPGLIGVIFQFLGAAYLMIKYAPAFLVFIIIGGIVLGGLNYAIKKPVKQAQREFRNSMGRKSIYVSEHLSRLMIVKAFDREETTVNNSADKFDDFYHKRMRRMRILLIKDSIQSSSSALGYLAVLIYCAVKIYVGSISYGTCMMLLRLLSQIRAPLTEVGSYISNIFDVSVAAERLMEAESFPDDSDQPVKSDQEIHSFYENDFREIVFRDAGFSYLDELESDPNTRPTVFEHVDLSIPKGSLVAFTGITGSGKSTFFKLLMSLYPLQEGIKTLLCVDGKELVLDAGYRRLFAYVPQGNQLMSGTIREMVSFGEKEADEATIWNVLEAACAKDFVKELTDGLDTQIGENGLGLSEGQMQRIAIARALYTKRPILLLDEATSSLDEGTEKQLLENIKAMTDCTILIVTHRPAALSICNKEVHIDGNRVSCRNLNDSIR